VSAGAIATYHAHLRDIAQAEELLGPKHQEFLTLHENSRQARIEALAATRGAVAGIMQSTPRVRELWEREEEPQFRPEGPLLPADGEQWTDALRAQAQRVAGAAQTYLGQVRLAGAREEWLRHRRRDRMTLGVLAGTGLLYAVMVWLTRLDLFELTVLLAVAFGVGGLVGRARGGFLLSRTTWGGRAGRPLAVAGWFTVGWAMFLSSFHPPQSSGWDQVSPITTLAVLLGFVLGGGLLVYLAVRFRQARAEHVR
jgi:hypothetical protein